MACSLPGFLVPGIFQARILEWVTISFSRSSWPRGWTRVSRIVGRRFTVWATREKVKGNWWNEFWYYILFNQTYPKYYHFNKSLIENYWYSSFYALFYIKSLKLHACFIFIAHLNLDYPCFKCSLAVCGYHIGQSLSEELKRDTLRSAWQGSVPGWVGASSQDWEGRVVSVWPTGFLRGL